VEEECNTNFWAVICHRPFLFLNKIYIIMKIKHATITFICMLFSFGAFSQKVTVYGSGGAIIKNGSIQLCPLASDLICGVIIVQVGAVENSSGNRIIIKDNDGKSFEGALIGPIPEDGVQGKDLVIRAGREM
jgi:hypothetical protein